MEIEHEGGELKEFRRLSDRATAPCVRCSAVVVTLGSLCTRCLQEACREHEQVRQMELLRKRPMLELLIDQKKVRHAARLGNPKLAYCEAKLMVKQPRRPTAKADELPQDICKECQARVAKLIWE